MQARLELRLLGAPETSLDGSPVLERLPRKAQAVLYYLAATGQSQTRSTLAGLLWGDLPEVAARSNLRKVLTNLRQTVGDHLDIKRHHVAFTPDGDCWIDVAAFEAGVGDASSATDTRRLQQAVDLYRGDFLTGFYVLHAPDFEAWLLAEQARLRELVVQALHTLAGAYTEPDQLPRGITYARRLLALEPWREEGHRLLMRLLARDGQRGAALAQYDLCRQALADELGVNPMPETTALYERILAGDLVKGKQRQASSPTHVGEAHRDEDREVPRHNLPAQLSPLIGRETELAELTQLLTDPDGRLVTILGSGGMGKTRLALEVAHAQVSNFPHGVYFVSLAPLTAPDSIVPTIAEAIDFSFHEGGTPQQQLFDYLHQKQMLLVLDSFEHLLAGVDLIVELLGSTSGLKTLVTSRAKLNVQAEQLCLISGVEVPQQGAGPEQAADFSAVKLFLHSARRVQPGFELKPDNVEHVIRICRWVEGMPLGILLAAAWLAFLDPAEIAAEIGRSPDFLESDLRDLPERQQSLRAVFDHSWRLMTEQEQTIFQQLSIFRGGFNHQAAQAVTGASWKALRALVNKSMLSRTAAGRYGIHDLLQGYGREKLAEEPARQATARQRHSAYYCAVLQQREVDLKGARQQMALAELEAEAENVRAAWDWAVEQGEVTRLNQSLESLCLFYQWRGRYVQGDAACRQAAEKLAARPSADSQRLLARVLTWQSVFSRIMGQTERATQLVQQSQALLDGPHLKRQDTRLEQAFTLLQRGHIAFYTDREEAKRLFQDSLDLYRAIDDWWSVANALDRLTRVVRLSSDYDQANRLQQECLTIRRSLGDQKGILSAICVLGLNAMFQDQFEEAERRRQEIQALLPAMSDRRSIADGTFTIGRILYFAAQLAPSRTWLEESLGIYEELGLRTGVSLINLGWLCQVMLDLGEYDEAFHKAQLELSLGREIGDRDSEAYGLTLLGLVELAREDYAAAHHLLQQSRDIYQALGQPKEVGEAWGFLGRAAYGLNDIPQASRCLSEALQIDLERRSKATAAFRISLGALLTANMGNYEGAVELHALTLQDPKVLISRWEKDVFGRQIEAVAATLPLDAVAAAQERGKARDFWATAAELLGEIEAGELSPAKPSSKDRR